MSILQDPERALKSNYSREDLEKAINELVEGRYIEVGASYRIINITGFGIRYIDDIDGKNKIGFKP